MTPTDQNTDNDLRKGAMEDEKFGERPMTSMNGQLGHRDQDPLLKSSDSDFPEPGENAEHNGEYKEPNQKDQDTRYAGTAANPEGATQDQDPGERQKENQNKKKDDDLAA
jgi:hypothetical protein